MLSAALVVFRETLEAALIVGIVMAACRGLAGRNAWVGGGVLAGLAGAVLIAVFAGAIGGALSGVGQEIFNAAVLGLAVVMLAWHVVWMSRHARRLASEVSRAGQDVATGVKPPLALAVIVAVAVLREGGETVLFLYGIMTAGQEPLIALAGGGAVGLMGGVAVGTLIYAGLVRLSIGRLFAVTNVLVVLLAAGMAADAAGFLVQADLLPALVPTIWDTSNFLSEEGIMGKALHTLTGYIARPSGIQVAFYGATIAMITALAHLAQPARLPRASRTAASLGAALLIAAGLVAVRPAPARAEFEVRSPIIDYRELEIEHKGSTTFDSRPEKRGDRKMVLEVGYGVTEFWKPSIEISWAREPGGKLIYDATAFENIFQLTPQGKYWADLGFFFEYERTTKREPDEISFGPIVQKEWGPTLHTLNVVFERQVGPEASRAYALKYAWQSRWRLHPLFEPGFEFHGAIEDVARAGRFSDQEHRVGPSISGLLLLGRYGKIKYQTAYLFGYSEAASCGAFRWQLEYELRF